MTQEIKVREMEIDDLPAVYALGEELFSAETLPTLYRTWDEYDVVDLFSADGDTCLVAERGGRLVGFVLGSVIEKRKGAWKYGYLEWIGVDPDVGGQGAGSRLFRALLERFIERGVRMVILDTETDNEGAIGFFKNLGFGQEHMHVYMSLNLTHHPEYMKRRQRNGSGGSRDPQERGR